MKVIIMADRIKDILKVHGEHVVTKQEEEVFVGVAGEDSAAQARNSQHSRTKRQVQV